MLSAKYTVKWKMWIRHCFFRQTICKKRDRFVSFDTPLSLLQYFIYFSLSDFHAMQYDLFSIVAFQIQIFDLLNEWVSWVCTCTLIVECLL